VTSWVDAAGAGPRALRDLFGTFMTGVTVVTMHDPEGNPTGFTANSFTSVSLDPPLVLVCVANGTRSSKSLAHAERFGINILTDAQRDVSGAFASGSGSRFDHVSTFMEPGGPPLIEGCLGSLDCSRERIVEAGDHAIVIGRVLGFRRQAGRPLGYYGGGYVSFGLGSEALEQHGGEAVVVGCVMAREDRVLLLRRSGRTTWELPTIPLRTGEGHRTALPRLLERLGVRADVSFLFSVFQLPGDPHTRMFFRGVMTEPLERSDRADGSELGLFSADQVPWTSLPGAGDSVVLKRFFREQAEARFGIYWDTDDGGRVASVEGVPQPWLGEGRTPE
jgi:flavin reductase (DIM6/NTAB) family NADH-FMN oxidoreductase RutF/ADP-ribose pyrophosphatase YjhB (NUDIX family)